METIQKLLNLAAKNPNQEEAASALAKANEWMTRYNLDVATIENNTGKKDGRREELKVDGGFYQFQRDLWASVADLNFCLVWTQKYNAEAVRYVDDYTGAKSMTPGFGKTRQKVSVVKSRIALVGRVVNTRTCQAMVSYLQVAVERALEERLGSLGKDDMSKTNNWSMSFRKGCIQGIVEKVQDRREAFLAEQWEKERKAARSATGVSTATGITISAYQDQEKDANMDFIYGEGWSAKQALQRAERAAARAKREAEYTAWAKANPEEAKAKQEALDKEARKSRYRGGSSPKDNTDYTAFYSGVDASKKISIDPQAAHQSNIAGRLK